MTDTSDIVLYRGMNRTALDAAYNNSAAVTDSPEWLAKWRSRSATMRERTDATLGIPFGPRERERIDYFPSGEKGAPLFVFVHGGYWIRNSIDMFSFLAAGPNAHGIDLAVIGYTLAPEAGLSEIADEIRRGLSFLQTQGDLRPYFGFDTARIHIGGWSAGGHLAAAIADHPAVKGVLPISGIFDLEPLSLNYINDSLKFTRNEIETLSPLRQLRRGRPPHRLVVGGGELPELQRQSHDFADAAWALSLPVSLNVLPGHHHFSILDELADPSGAIVQELNKLIAA